MKNKKLPCRLLFAAGSSLLAISSASAQTGTWNAGVAGGTSTWTNPGMWLNSVIANDTDNTANFTGLNITGPKIVNLGAVDRTIGNITFTDETTPNNDLTIAQRTLTLDVTTGAPQINSTNRTLTISSIIAGNDGLTKIGAGGLTLNGVNIYSGTTTLSGGLTIAGNNAAFGTSAIAFSGTATGLQLGDGVDLANNITIGTNTGTAGQGLLKVANGQSATLSGTITINNNAGSGSHFGGTSTTGTGILNITNTITSAVTVSQRSGTVVLSGGGTYSNFNLAAGTLKLGALNGFSTGSALTIANAVGENATFDLAGFNQSLVGITKGSGSTATISNSSTAADSTLTTTGTSTFSGIIQDTLGSGDQTVALTVNGGALTLSGANTYSGNTTVTGNGKLLINGSISTSTAVTVDSGSTLGGSGGTVGGSTTVNGVLASGSSIGTLSFSNALALGATSTYLFELNNTTDLADLTNVAGTFTIGSGAILDLVQLGTYAVGDKFTLFGYASTLTGTFSGLANLSTFNDAGGDWQINYSDLTAGLNGGTGASFVTITAVPEPRAALLGGLGLLALLRRRRD